MKLFLFSTPRGLVVPDDLRQRLLRFVPAPPAPELATLEELPTHVFPDGDPGASTGATAAAMRVLSGHLSGGDFYPPEARQHTWQQVIGPIKAFAWPMLLQASGLAKLNGARLERSPAGITSRIDLRCPQTTGRSPQRKPIREAGHERPDHPSRGAGLRLS